MGLLLYAITTPATAEPPAGLLRVQVDGLTAWASQLGDEPSVFGREDVLAHHRVVAEVFEVVDACLPARFPTVLADEDAIRQVLLSGAQELGKGLEAVRGAAELAVTAVWTSHEEDAPDIDASSPGRGYLLRRQAALTASERRRTQAEQLADELERACGAGLRNAERHVCPSTEVALSLALLVERDLAEPIKHQVLRQMRADVRILVHGPWPPYTFAQRRDGGAEA